MKLNATTLRWTATVVRQRCNVNDFSNLNAGSVDGTDSALTTITRTLNISLYLTQTQLESCLSAILSCHLGSVRSVLLRSAESHLTS